MQLTQGVLEFCKYHGLGNDFILVDNRHQEEPVITAEQAVKLCDRNFGIGGDGVIFALPAKGNVDYSMRIFNSDGSEPEMCGNGIRCLARFVAEKDSEAPRTYKVHTLAGLIQPELLRDGQVCVDMGEPILDAQDIPTTLPPTEGDTVVKAPLTIHGKTWLMTCVSMGNPHAITFGGAGERIKVADLDIFTIGPLFEVHQVFPVRTNTEFVEVVDRGHVKMVVWERGAGRTLACGTGACATVVAGVLEGKTDRNCRVDLPGGPLQIEWRESNNHVYMTGPAELVFAGSWLSAQGLRPATDINFAEQLNSPVEARQKAVYGWVTLKDSIYAFTSSPDADAVASGSYIDAVHTVSNFGQLRVSTAAAFDDAEQMYAAGYLEGWLSAERIYDYYINTHEYFLHQLNASLPVPMKWLEDQDSWVRQQAESESTPYWAYMKALLAQFDGMVAGYQARSDAAGDGSRIPPLTKADFLFTNGNGELYDILDGLQPTDYDSMPAHQLRATLALSGRCSALVKVTGDLSDLLMGHSTWDTYSSMSKLYKHYHFALHNPAVAAQRMSFSSYPGELFSDDDMYMMDSQLVVLSTTNHIYNMSLFNLLTPQSLVSWQRVRAANALATNGSQWSSYLDVHNSGTYNNQYMVVDLKKFRPGHDLQPGVLWVAEQIPGLVKAADMTETLSRGYFPSFNVPYFPEIYRRSGFPALKARQEARGADYADAASWLSYQLAPRAKIFRRDAGKVADLASLKKIMRHNNYKDDPYSNGDPIAAICGRGDLDPANPVPKGCFDSKVTSYKLALALEAEVVNGPTTAYHLPPFRWTKQFDDVMHQGQAQVFDYEFERQTPVLDGGAVQK
ncbi:hypothetical protein WJX72_004015 [[Myrmecia] bisecta]|uniref:diaminopimelate epimerase n=1 Tax=[Myrmecia] bisecta TaxID=41462 RepID=A0AAW1P6M3_9CHLO